MSRLLRHGAGPPHLIPPVCPAPWAQLPKEPQSSLIRLGQRVRLGGGPCLELSAPPWGPEHLPWQGG